MDVEKTENSNNETSWFFEDNTLVKEIYPFNWFAVYSGVTFLGYIKPKSYKEYMNMYHLLCVGSHPILDKWNPDIYSWFGWDLQYTIPLLDNQRRYKRTVEAFPSIYEAAQYAPKDAQQLTVVSGRYAGVRVWAFVEPEEGITLDNQWLLSDIEDMWSPDDDSVVMAY